MGGALELPFGCATSVGPVPFDEPGAAAEFALAASGLIAAPTLSGVEGSLLAQAVQGLPGVDVTPPGLLCVDKAVLQHASGSEVRLELGGPADAALGGFLSGLGPANGDRVGVRVAVLGPVTLALALRAAGLAQEPSLAIARLAVQRRASLVLSTVRAVTSEPVLVCLNEPGLIGAMHPTFPLTPAEVAELLEPVVWHLDRDPHAGQMLIGVHVPGRTDWRTVVATGVSLISTPVSDDLVGWAAQLADFLERGGRVVWGAVPVDQPLGSTEELLWRRLSAMWCALVGEGVDPLLLRSRSLVGPADGLGHFGASQARLALELVESISTRVRRQTVGARLTLGA